MKVVQKYYPQILVKLRKKRKLTHERAVRLMSSEVGLNISRPTLISWEKGITSPDIKHVPFICVFYNVSIVEFIRLFFGLKHSIAGYARPEGRSRAVR